MSEQGQAQPRSYRPSDLLRSEDALGDGLLPPVVFVLVNLSAGLTPAAVAAFAAALLLLGWRLVKRQRAVNAVGGVFGVGIAVGIALATGDAEDYFLPKVISNAALAAGFTLSAAFRQPAVGWMAVALYRLPEGWLRDARVRRPFAEVTCAWATLFGARAALFAALIGAGELGWLLAVSFATGLPALVLLLLGTYPYLRRRMAALGAPPPERFATAAS